MVIINIIKIHVYIFVIQFSLKLSNLINNIKETF